MLDTEIKGITPALQPMAAGKMIPHRAIVMLSIFFFSTVSDAAEEVTQGSHLMKKTAR